MTVVVARTTRDVLTVAGPDALTWLQGQLSQDVAALVVGEARWSFVLAPDGKVEGWGRVARLGEDEVQVDVDPGSGDRWRARLERFKLRTKAAVTLREGVEALAVRGTRPESSLPLAWPGAEGGDLIEPDPGVLEALVAAGAAEVDAADLESERIRAGAPRWGAEIDGDTIPATLGQWVIDASVSFTKGCYTGQELVARIDSRGGNVPRRLAVLTVAGSGALRPGEAVTADGEEAGTVTSVAVDHGAGEAVALVFVPRRIELPTEVEVGGRSGTLAQPGPAASGG